MVVAAKKITEKSPELLVDAFGRIVFLVHSKKAFHALVKFFVDRRVGLLEIIG